MAKIQQKNDYRDREALQQLEASLPTFVIPQNTNPQPAPIMDMMGPKVARNPFIEEQPNPP